VISNAAMAAIDGAVEREMERARLPGLTLGLTDREGTQPLVCDVSNRDRRFDQQDDLDA